MTIQTAIRLGKKLIPMLNDFPWVWLEELKEVLETLIKFAEATLAEDQAKVPKQVGFGK